ncbi:MAG: CoA pyrophosphatase [Gaiellales bacterium]
MRLEEDGLQVAAVLAPVFRDGAGMLRTVLVVRADHGRHGNQLGFPGGKPEPGDDGLLSTALREAEEEVGLASRTVEILAALPPLDTRQTGFRVYGFVGRIPSGTTWRLDTHEIVGILTPTIAELAAPEARSTLPFASSHYPEGFMVEGIDVDGHVLWGMTLRLLDGLVPRLLAGEWAV